MYYSAPGGDAAPGITTEDSPLVFVESSYSFVAVGPHRVELNFVRLAPFTLRALVDDFAINAICAGFEIAAGSAGAGACYESAAFDDWLTDRVLRPAKIQGAARLCVRLAYKSMQLGRPADYGGLDPADGEMAGEAYPRKLVALRQAGFRQPECFRGLVLRRRQEDGVFANTGEPRVFYHLERGGGSAAAAAVPWWEGARRRRCGVDGADI